MKKLLFCSVTVLLMICVLCLPLFSATGAPAATYLLGDVDGDGEIGILDVTTAQRILAHLNVNDDGMCAIRGDVDGDGELTSFDVTWIQRYLAHLTVPYPIDTEITAPTEEPTEVEIVEPTAEPTEAPTEAPTAAPTVKPTSKPDPYELPPI